MGMSLFQTQLNNNSGYTQQLKMVNELKQAMGNKDPNAIANLLCQRNPQFNQFVNECRGMSVNQICNKYGLNYNQISELIGKR